MNKKAKILFFCTIFVVKNGAAQKNALLSSPPYTSQSIENQKNIIVFDTFKLPKAYNKNFVKFPKKVDPISPKTANPALPPVISNNFYTQNFGFFCKKELQLEKAIKIPFKFRLGSVQQCDWMEGKPNAVSTY